MNKVTEILNFHFSSENFSERGRTVIPTHISNLNRVRISVLEKISQDIGESAFEKKPVKDIKQVFLKFKRFINKNDGENKNFDKRELRTLTYTLDFEMSNQNAIFKSDTEVKQAIDLLNQDWRDSYISGLLHCYFSNWKNRGELSFHHLSTFILEKITGYNGTRRLYLNLKAKIKYFDSRKGDLELGAYMALKNLRLSEVTNYLTVPDTWITYHYFSGVITGFLERSRTNLDEHLEEITATLNAHSSFTRGTQTNRIVVSRIICFTVDSNETLQDRVKDIAFSLVGDPGLSSNWRPFEDTSAVDVETIKRAREILNEWITRQFISVFFEKCINDVRRKRFWLKYSKKITQFKVFGPKSVMKELKNDDRISKYVEGRFQIVDSKRNISAFMFLMGEHKMIEFSDPGYAFYAYKLANNYAPKFDIKYLNSVDEFRNGNMPMLVYRTGYSLHSFSSEGRLNHKDGDLQWESVFSYWINKMSGIDV